MEDAEEVLKVLNNLAEVSRDGEAGFRTCAADSSDPALKAYFEECAQRCDRAAALLAVEVENRGGKADLTGTNALLYPRWGDWAVLDSATGQVKAAGFFDENWQ